MMTEILKPLLENNVLTDEVKEALEHSLTEAISTTEAKVKAEVEEKAKLQFNAAKEKFEKTYKTLEESYKSKLEDAQVIIEEAKDNIEELESTVEELETKPFVNVSESDLEKAENVLTEELEEKYETAFDLAKAKFNSTFDIVTEGTSLIISELEDQLNDIMLENDSLTESNISLTTEIETLTTEIETLSQEDKINEAIEETETRVLAEAEAKISTLKENLVSSTEIFLEQELSEMKADYEEMMKESQGRELLESLKGVVKQYWDIDTEVAEEILEMKKDAESKVEQYREMLKNEHSRLSEAQEENETLKKSVILEKKASILSTDKKEALTKLSENIDADKLESQIDSLMESVVDTFNAGFTSTEINKQINKKEINNDTLNESTQSIISSGDTETKASTELSNLMDLAGIR